MPFDDSLKCAKDLLGNNIGNPESSIKDDLPSNNSDVGDHDEYPIEEHNINDAENDLEDANRMQDASTDSEDSFLESLIEEATPEFTFIDTLSRISVLSLLAYTYKVRFRLLARVSI